MQTLSLPVQTAALWREREREREREKGHSCGAEVYIIEKAS